ncbi:MAG: DUF4139 domain-containing protein [Bacteroidetes bacterium]|nr:DUF4139 domain-containing protein [Bacteroidota bacterium]
MKKIIALFLVISAYAHAQDVNTLKIASKIKQVTVFITGGEEHRTATVSLKKGRNKLVFTDISTVADHKSVQFNSNKAFNLVSVSSEIDYISFVDNNPRIKQLQDTLQLMRTKVVDLQNELDAYQQEKNLLQKNTDIKGEQENLSVEELKAMAVYYRTRIMELNKIMTDYNNKISETNTTIWRYQNQLTELNYKETIKSNQIIVMVDVEEATTMDVDLKYIVSNCGWQANYDLSAENISGKIELKYKAKVFNNTGNDWDNVDLVLSTSDPNVSASAPTLTPWYLNYNSMTDFEGDYLKKEQYVVPQNRMYSQYSWNSNVAPQMTQNLDGLTLGGNTGITNTWDFGGGTNPTGSSVSFTTIEVSQLSREFVIARKYTIPSDSKPYLVDITTHQLEATFSHKAVPKLDKDAFLLANIVGWEKLDLVPGPTNVYFAETYVGQSYMNTANVEDTLRLSFGRDTRVEITRRLMEEYSDKKVIGPNRKDSYTYEIKVKNNRETPVQMSLFDQVPISQDSDIEVTIDEISGADHDLTTGRLLWLVDLAPGQTATYKLAFTIKYPKDRKITVQKYRTVSAPKF